MSNAEKLPPKRDLVEDIGILVEELSLARDAYDRAKPVLDAARAVAWSNVRACVEAYAEDEREPQRYRDDYRQALNQLLALTAAVDAYDTAQKAPANHRYIPGQGILCGRCNADHGVFGPEPRWFTCDDCGLAAPIDDFDQIPGMAPETAPESTLSHEPAEVDHPDADTTDPPTWRTEVYTAAGLAMVRVDPDDDEADYYEWHECDDQPNCNVVSRGEPCPCSGKPWPSAVVRAALDAAAPIIRRAAEQERDEARHHHATALEIIEGTEADCRAAETERDALRAQLADAHERNERYERLHGAVTEWRVNRLDNDAIHAVLTALDGVAAEVPPDERVAVLRAQLADARREVDTVRAVAQSNKEALRHALGYTVTLTTERDALRAILADAERDALNRAADDIERAYAIGDGPELAVSPSTAAWLRERAKAVRP